jgi:hypothetical protein
LRANKKGEGAFLCGIPEYCFTQYQLITLFCFASNYLLISITFSCSSQIAGNISAGHHLPTFFEFAKPHQIRCYLWEISGFYSAEAYAAWWLSLLLCSFYYSTSINVFRPKKI